ncbi:MAG: methyltransferase, TIGR04325 family [Alphaproteobacteria bacterium]
MTNPLFSVWEGVFKSFEEAGGDTDAFESDIWINKQKEKITCLFNEYEKGNIFSKDYPLPVIIAMILGHQKQASVLDFGGGMGMQYLDVIGKVPKAKHDVVYTIVDGESTLKNTPKFMENFQNLRYCYSLDQVQGNFDVLHIGSTLQYIEDWKGLLEKLISDYSPKYFVFSDLMVGDIPTFVSHQIFYEKRIPYLFLNIKEFKKFLATYNFNSIFCSLYKQTILGYKIFPNFSLPKDHRITHTQNLVFMR